MSREEVTIAEAMASYFKDGMIGDPEMKRITCIGVSDRFSIPRPMILVASIAAIMIAFSFGKTLKHTKKENEMF